jgi:hypothetical protein
MSLLLALLLLGPTHVDRDTEIATGAMMFSVHVDNAAAKAGIPTSRIQIDQSDVFRAWVNIPVDWVIWVDRDYLSKMDDRALCLSAFHEVCHQRLDLMAQHDGDDHQALYRCMVALMEPKDCR